MCRKEGAERCSKFRNATLLKTSGIEYVMHTGYQFQNWGGGLTAANKLLPFNSDVDVNTQICSVLF
jgi:hypothetical protein